MSHENHRATSLLVYDHLYDVRGDRYGDCTYCGVPACVLDHIPPISWTALVKEEAKKELSFYKVPSCVECNSALGNLRLLSVIERVQYIKGWLKKKYKKPLRMPYWDEDELAELSSTMVAEIRKAAEQSAWVKSRVTYRPEKELLMLSCYEGDKCA
jgi:hypothetical protein